MAVTCASHHFLAGLAILPGAASTSVMRNKGTEGKKPNRRKRLEKMFLCSLITWEKKNKSIQHEDICVSENLSS